LGAFTDSVVENSVILLGDINLKILKVDEISVKRQEHKVANKVHTKQQYQVRSHLYTHWQCVPLDRAPGSSFAATPAADIFVSV